MTVRVMVLVGAISLLPLCACGPSKDQMVRKFQLKCAEAFTPPQCQVLVSMYAQSIDATEAATVAAGGAGFAAGMSAARR